MKPVSTMVIPPKAVSRLFDACANAKEGADCPSLFDFGANFTIGHGNRYLNWAARAEDNGALADFTGEQTGSHRHEKHDFDDYLMNLWLSRMTEDYQRSYRQLMETLDEADEFCKNALKEIERRLKWADNELDRLREQIVVIDGEECWIRNGVIVGRDGLPSKLSKDKQDEALRIYTNDPKRRAAAERGGQVIDFREKNKELSTELDEHEQCAKGLRERAESKDMTKEELDSEADKFKETTRRLQEKINAADGDIMNDYKNSQPTKTINFENPPADLTIDLHDRPLTGSAISRVDPIITLKAKTDLDVDLDDNSLTAQFTNSTVKPDDAVEEENNPRIARRAASPIIAFSPGTR